MLLNRALFYLQLAWLFFAVSTDGKKKRRRKEQYADDPEIEVQNICDIAGPTIIYCYCDSQKINEVSMMSLIFYAIIYPFTINVIITCCEKRVQLLSYTSSQS